MNHLEQAIRDAVEKGGYNAGHVLHLIPLIPLDDVRAFRGAYVLDPRWWKALAKARGWNGKSFDPGDARDGLVEEWEHNWTRLIHHLAAGEPIESFFQEL